MKKTIALIALVLVLALGMASVAGATLVGAVYHIEEGNLLVTIPAGYHALTRAIEEGDPALSHFGLTRDYAVSFQQKPPPAFYIFPLTSQGNCGILWLLSVFCYVTLNPTDGTPTQVPLFLCAFAKQP